MQVFAGLYTGKVTFNRMLQNTGQSNLVPRVSHFTAPGASEEKSLAPGGSKMRDLGNEVGTKPPGNRRSKMYWCNLKTLGARLLKKQRR